MIASRPIPSVERRKQDGAANEVSHDAKPPSRLLDGATANWAGRADHIVLGHSHLLSNSANSSLADTPAGAALSPPAAPVVSLSCACCERDARYASTLRIVEASAVAEKSKSVSARA